MAGVKRQLSEGNDSDNKKIGREKNPHNKNSFQRCNKTAFQGNQKLKHIYLHAFELFSLSRVASHAAINSISLWN